MGGLCSEHLCGTVGGKGSFLVVLRELNVAGCSFFFFFFFPLKKLFFFAVQTDLLVRAVSGTKWGWAEAFQCQVLHVALISWRAVATICFFQLI